MKCFLIDIDGTLADGAHRIHHLQATPKNWDAYFDACKDDTPIQHMRQVVLSLDCRMAIIYVTGRVERTRAETQRWLYRHGFPVAPIYMRPDGDFRADDVVKMELLANIRLDGYEPIMAFDDRDRVVKAWRAAGIPCAQVAEGDF